MAGKATEGREQDSRREARYGGGAALPLAIMVSDDTEAKTKELLKKHSNFGMAEGQAMPSPLLIAGYFLSSQTGYSHSHSQL